MPKPNRKVSGSAIIKEVRRSARSPVSWEIAIITTGQFNEKLLDQLVAMMGQEVNYSMEAINAKTKSE